MDKYKECTKCSRSLPATSEYYYKNKGLKDGLENTCKKCRKKRFNRKSLERRKKGLHLIHELNCDWCKEDFKADTKDRRFCSRDCQYEWQRNSKEYKDILDKGFLAFHNQFGDYRTREERFINNFEEYNKGFSYHSGFIDIDSYFKSECNACGHVQERSAICARPSRKERAISCEKCSAKARSARRIGTLLSNYLKRLETNKQKLKRKKARKEVRLLKRIKRKHNLHLKCEECGRMFFNNREKFTCSDCCANKRANRIKDINRREQLVMNGDVDWTISLQQVQERDDSICYLCDEPVNNDDYTIRYDGTFIAGQDYPSIDHVQPVARGGTHTWGNVRLAHRGCNTNKSDRKLIKQN